MIVYSNYDLGPQFFIIKLTPDAKWKFLWKAASHQKKGVFLSKQPKSFPQQRLSKKHFCWSGCKSGISIVDSVTVPSKSFYIKNNPLPKNKRGTNQHMSGKNWKKTAQGVSVLFSFLFRAERWWWWQCHKPLSSSCKELLSLVLIAVLFIPVRVPKLLNFHSLAYLPTFTCLTSSVLRVLPQLFY